MAAGHNTGKSLRNRAVRFSARGARAGFLIVSLEHEDRLPDGSVLVVRLLFLFCDHVYQGFLSCFPITSSSQLKKRNSPAIIYINKAGKQRNTVIQNNKNNENADRISMVTLLSHFNRFLNIFFLLTIRLYFSHPPCDCY